MIVDTDVRCPATSIFMSRPAISHHLHDLCRNSQAGGGAATQDTLVIIVSSYPDILLSSCLDI